MTPDSHIDSNLSPPHIPTMRVTTWTEYSLIISLHLAKRGGSGGGPVAVRELADLERLPADYAEQILLRLRRAVWCRASAVPREGTTSPSSRRRFRSATS